MHTLYLVATPIGNREDITLRALRILKESSLILCEDTRHSGPLMKYYEVDTKLASYHEFNKEKVGAKYIEHLKNEGDIALISDAGTPGIADPGFNLVRDCAKEDIEVISIPGACAIVTGLVASGMPTDRFRFEYFAPKKSAARKRLFEELKEATSTICFYVSPHQVLKVLNELGEVYGDDFNIVFSRELTKKFEEQLRGTVAEIKLHYKERKPKGEFVLFYHPQNKGL